jgi:polyhydroxyalkanoate synthesis regulator phasin
MKPKLTSRERAEKVVDEFDGSIVEQMDAEAREYVVKYVSDGIEEAVQDNTMGDQSDLVEVLRDDIRGFKERISELENKLDLVRNL